MLFLGVAFRFFVDYFEEIVVSWRLGEEVGGIRMYVRVWGREWGGVKK